MKICSIPGCESQYFCKSYCKNHYARFYKNGDPYKRKSSSRKIDYKVTETGCFECTSHAVNSTGYFFIRNNGKTYQLHRFIYKEMFGEIPKGLVVRHKCDNRKCINPEHLELGTLADNNRDRVERGRSGDVKGEKVGTSKLKESEVKEIKSLLREGVKGKRIAKIFNVSESAISCIKRGERWQHVK